MYTQNCVNSSLIVYKNSCFIATLNWDRSINQSINESMIVLLTFKAIITSLHFVYLMVHDSNEVTSSAGLPLTTLICCSAAYNMVVLDTTSKAHAQLSV